MTNNLQPQIFIQSCCVSESDNLFRAAENNQVFHSTELVVQPFSLLIFPSISITALTKYKYKYKFKYKYKPTSVDTKSYHFAIRDRLKIQSQKVWSAKNMKNHKTVKIVIFHHFHHHHCTVVVIIKSSWFVSVICLHQPCHRECVVITIIMVTII